MDTGVQLAKEKGIGVVKKLEHKGKELEFSEEEQQLIYQRVGYGAIKYFDLSTTRTNNYVFSYDRMLAMDGNTAVYLLYSYARMYSSTGRFVPVGCRVPSLLSTMMGAFPKGMCR